MDAYQILMKKLGQLVDKIEKQITTSTVSDFIPSSSGNKYKGKRNYADGTAINEKLPKSYQKLPKSYQALLGGKDFKNDQFKQKADQLESYLERELNPIVGCLEENGNVKGYRQ